MERASATTARVDGRDVIIFGGCDYLGLSCHPAVTASAVRSLTKTGISVSASRETIGNTPAHERLERTIEGFLGLESALLTPEGLTANLAAAAVLGRTTDLLLVDEGSHASVHDAARSTGIEIQTYTHLDGVDAVTRIKANPGRRLAIFTDGYFADDGAPAPVEPILRALPDSGVLVLDECHAFGVIGPRGRGTLDLLGINDPRVVITSTLAKSIGCFGGFVAADASFVERARDSTPCYCTTPVPPALAEAARTAIELIDADRSMLMRLRANGERLRAILTRQGVVTSPRALPVFAFTLDSIKRMRAVRDHLLDAGVLFPLISYPGSRTGEFFRVTATAAHTDDQLDLLDNALDRAMVEARSLVGSADGA